MLHQHTPGKSPCGMVIKHVLIELVRRAVGHTVGNQRVVVHVLLLVGDDAAVALALCPLAREGQVELVAGDAIMERDGVVVHPAVTLLVDIDVAHAYILIVGLLQAVEVERGTLADVGLYDLRG